MTQHGRDERGNEVERESAEVWHGMETIYGNVGRSKCSQNELRKRRELETVEEQTHQATGVRNALRTIS